MVYLTFSLITVAKYLIEYVSELASRQRTSEECNSDENLSEYESPEEYEENNEINLVVELRNEKEKKNQ